MLGSCKVSVYGRDNMMELLIKFVTRKDGVGWSKKFIEASGLCLFGILLVEMLITLHTSEAAVVLFLVLSVRMCVTVCVSVCLWFLASGLQC